MEKHVTVHPFWVVPVFEKDTPLSRREYKKSPLERGLRGGLTVTDIRTIQELLGHKDVSTTMIYAHVLNKSGHGVQSPVDRL